MAQVGATESRLQAAASGTGTFCPLVFNTGGSERVRIDTSGNTGFGGAAAAGTKVNALGTLPSSSTNTTAFGADGTIPSTTTNIYSGFTSGATTEATSFTLSAYQHFRAAQTAFGAGSTVTNQQGFFAASSLTGATNNYGFFSNIASGSNRWNFYAAGTADNYFAGNVGIGTASPNAKFNVLSADNSATTVIASFDANNASQRIQIGYNKIAQYANTAGISFYTNGINGTERMTITNTGNVVAGGSVALATTATDGFLYVPTCAGTPTGTPTAITGMAPIVVNTTNNKLYFYSGGAWRDAGP
jgi:hypothetical protein